MPHQAKTHDEFRKSLCLFCAKKSTSPRKITANLLEKIKVIKGYENVEISDTRFPTALCSQHYNVIYRKPLEKAHLLLPIPIDYKQYPMPRTTRSSKKCEKNCLICGVVDQPFQIFELVLLLEG